VWSKLGPENAHGHAGVVRWACRNEFDCDVGPIGIDDSGMRPTFGNDIVCPGCGKLTGDDVLLTELGQTQDRSHHGTVERGGQDSREWCKSLDSVTAAVDYHRPPTLASKAFTSFRMGSSICVSDSFSSHWLTGRSAES
jgi:hypothetical protein